MSLMDLIHRAWKYACDTLNKHDHITRPPDVDVLFMEELNKLDDDISHVVAMLYSNYAELEEKYNKLKDDNDKS